jgi:Rieske Fe-S protein
MVGKDKPRQLEPPRPAADPERRGFLTKFLAVVVGGLVAIFPFAAGLTVFADPLRKRAAREGGRRDEDGYTKILSANLESLPVGEPRRFVVIDDLVDAWNVFPDEPIGAVFLTRSRDNKVTALSATCPHAGCSVGYHGSEQLFRCPCHDSSYRPDGELANEQSPAPRGLDPLEVKVKGSEIWVKYVKFVGGKAERIVKT